jgi:hypothetical protein
MSWESEECGLYGHTAARMINNDWAVLSYYGSGIKILPLSCWSSHACCQTGLTMNASPCLLPILKRNSYFFLMINFDFQDSGHHLYHLSIVHPEFWFFFWTPPSVRHAASDKFLKPCCVFAWSHRATINPSVFLLAGHPGWVQNHGTQSLSRVAKPLGYERVPVLKVVHRMISLRFCWHNSSQHLFWVGESLSGLCFPLRESQMIIKQNAHRQSLVQVILLQVL